MPKRLIPVLSLAAAIVLLVMLNFTTPAGVGPPGVLVFFGSGYLLMYGIAYLVVKVFAAVGRHRMGRKQYLYAAVLAFGPIMLLLAQSLGSVSFLTVGLMVIFVFLACFLISKK